MQEAIEKSLKKLQDYEKKVFPALDSLEEAGKMPDVLKKRFDAVKDGDTSADAYAGLSNALFDYADMFDEKDRSHITQYRELIDTYFNEVE